MVRVLSVYLAATIFVCPLYCRFTQCSVAAEGTAPICSCCHRHGLPVAPAEHPSAPEPRPCDSGGSCQCICGGAVVDAAGSLVPDLDTSWWSPVAIILPRLAHSNEMPFDLFCAALWPDDGMNTGRSLCCLYSTLQC
jgi:hypothetical protein